MLLLLISFGICVHCVHDVLGPLLSCRIVYHVVLLMHFPTVFLFLLLENYGHVLFPRLLSFVCFSLRRCFYSCFHISSSVVRWMFLCRYITGIHQWKPHKTIQTSSRPQPEMLIPNQFFIGSQTLEIKPKRPGKEGGEGNPSGAQSGVGRDCGSIWHCGCCGW